MGDPVMRFMRSTVACKSAFVMVFMAWLFLVVELFSDHMLQTNYGSRVVNTCIFKNKSSAAIGDYGSVIWVCVPELFLGYAICSVFWYINCICYDGYIFHIFKR